MEELGPWIANDQQQKQNYAKIDLKKHHFSLRNNQPRKLIEKLPLLQIKKKQKISKHPQESLNQKIRQFEEDIIVKKYKQCQSNRIQRNALETLKTTSVNLSNNFNYLQRKPQHDWGHERIENAMFKIRKQFRQLSSVSQLNLSNLSYDKNCIRKSVESENQQYKAERPLQKIKRDTLTKFNLFKKGQKQVYAFN